MKDTELRKLSSYEKRALRRFLGIYLGSVFILLSIIGWLFYEHNAMLLKSNIKLEMLSEAHRIEALLMRRLMMVDRKDSLKETLKDIKSPHFRVGYYDKNHKAIYSEIETSPDLERPFYQERQSCYGMLSCPMERHGIAYIALQDTQYSNTIKDLRYRIILYLVISFIFMSGVGYFLAKLFLKPVREKIDALDRFIEETTHELNTPVSAILMTIQRLKGIEEKKLSRLKAAAQRLAMIYETLSYSLSKDGIDEPKESIALDEFIKNRIEEIKPISQSKRIEFELSLKPCQIEISKENIRRVIDNLLSNAIKYSNPSSKVKIVLKSCILEIEDEGIGMSDSDIERIFHRYERAESDRGGFGLGLAIVSQICNRYGILLSCQSKIGKGSIFTLNFKNISPQ